MISVQNHRPPLSGNKRLLFLWIALVVAACSPKLQPAPAPVKPPAEKPIPPKQEEKPLVKAPPKVAVISMLLPFGLDHLSPGSNYTEISLKKANMSLDYYQGFKLALDSLSLQGYNYKLQLYDSNDDPAEAHTLAYNPKIRASDLIVGPVFPDGMKAFAAVLPGMRKPILSPLSPAPPATIQNQNLITIIPPLEYHARAAAKYINDRIKPKKVFILKSGYTEEAEYIIPFKNAIDSLSKKHIAVIQLTVIRGKLTALLPQLSATGQNVFVIPSTNQAFLMVTMRSLDTLANKHPVILFGHPNWSKFGFLKAKVLQHLKTHITSSDRVNYKSAATIAFLRDYRKIYHVEPTDFAIKGFDEGFYFGQLLGNNPDGLKIPELPDFNGLNNNFHFIKKPGLGWINTHINIFTYTNFELKQVE